MTDPLEDVCFVLSLWELKVFSIHHTPHHNHLLSPALPPHQNKEKKKEKSDLWCMTFL